MTVSSELPPDGSRLPVAGDAAGPGLEAAVQLAERVLPSATVVSVTLLRDGRPYTPSMTGRTALELDEAQYQAAQGPCLRAAGGGGPSNVVVADEAGRWPEFSAVASGAGIHSVLSVPLIVGEQAQGALNIYSRSDRPFNVDEQALAALLARQAAVVVAAANALIDAQRMAAQLREALETRDVIGQAKGILMEREGCTPEAAFDVLRRASQRTNRKLRDVAIDLTSSQARRGRR